ncbi:MAG: hypothetical protein GY832_35285 [Chloroflexi bacterium]|nr:hypothetical protein [Chloroflexota bacterium]
MKIRIITSCTGEKQHSPANQLAQSDFERLHDSEQFQALEDRLADFRTPAEDLYTGIQHVRLMDGVQRFREKYGADSLDLWILSAGYGLIPGAREIVPYECTFQGMKAKEIDTWAEHLRVSQGARELLAQPADLLLVLLGDSYLRALALDDTVRFAAPALFFTGKASQKRVKGQGTPRAVPVSNAETKRFSCGLVGLKGELAKRILHHLADKGDSLLAQLLDPAIDVLSLLDGDSSPPDSPAKPKSAKSSKARPNPDVDYVINIPDSWWNKPHQQRLRYFIPEWDDLVDPDYDFLTDTHSGGRGDWSNETYAHQMYPEPNYDGILVSKVVAEKTKKKKKRINEMGVHRYLRVPPEFPIMGDCGAFGYIQEENPPYTTDEILEYYTRLGFDYGVSIDHLVVAATEDQKHFRYELTIQNAAEFLKEHRKRDLPWEPIGAVQGWDAESYAKAARQYVTMGYKYIALGGLVRSSTKEIMRILSAVHEVVPETVAIHLFGIARLQVMPDFASLGVRSVDSASFLRRAWMGSGGQNYMTENGFYTAIRIPEAGKSFRAKRMVQEGRADAEKVKRLEKLCMKAVRDFDKGLLSVEETLDVIDEYDRLITPKRKDIRPMLRATLESAPWKSCPCDICRRDGIEVIIFRGNNRNRRRGFHNIYAFYRSLQRILLEENVNLSMSVHKSEGHKQLSLF